MTFLSKIFTIKYIRELVFLFLTIISFLFFYFIPVTYNKDYSFKISTALFTFVDEDAPPFLLSSFELAKIFNGYSRYNLTKNYLSRKYLLNYDDFYTRGLNEGNNLTISIKTNSQINPVDIERFAKFIRLEMTNAVLMQFNKSGINIAKKGDFLLVSISETDNINLKKKAPILSLILFLLFYFFTNTNIVRIFLAK